MNLDTFTLEFVYATHCVMIRMCSSHWLYVSICKYHFMENKLAYFIVVESTSICLESVL